MINYALALELKNAGFPQSPGINGDDVRKQIRYGFPTYICEHGNRCGKAHCESSVYFPRLAELIDQCKERFASLHKILSDDTWEALSWMTEDQSEFEEGLGETPEVAVANLWLELNRK